MGLGAAGDVVELAVGSEGRSVPVVVQRSIRSCVVSSGRFSSMARPYRARLFSAYKLGGINIQKAKKKKEKKRGKIHTASGPNFLR